MNLKKKISRLFDGNTSVFIWGAIIVVAIVGIIIDRHNVEAEEIRPEGIVLESNHYPDLDKVNLPPLTPSQFVEYEGFSVSFNKKNKTPNYAAWELLGEETYGDASRTNKFWHDSKVKGCSTLEDYKRSGYDRGHLCPAADQKWSEKAMHECFVLANICPQDHALNAGAWNTLEDKCRSWARRDSALVIVAGPLYSDADTLTIGPGKVRVPSMFFKVVLAPYLEEPRAIGFLYPNMSAPGSMDNYATSVDEIEQLTGMDFFSSLPDSLENKIEKSFSLKAWNRRL